MSGTHRGRLTAVIVGLAVCAIGAYAAVTYIPPLLRGTGCEARTSEHSVELTPAQMENAATVAAVGMREELPRRAVTIALAAAFQESKLHNLPYGDRDSVGLFQQRPSQGWGRRAQLLDPVYASAAFYEHLIRIPDYRTMSVHEAAQSVQRSADGRAYAQHTGEAKVLSAVLTGDAAAGLRCWFQDSVGTVDYRSVRTQLTREFGQRVRVQASDDGLDVRTSGRREGWTVALWAVSNAGDLGVRSVEFRGVRWTAEDGYDGWQQAQVRTSDVRIGGNT